MRAQLRTYHAIPSLQAHQDAHAYKQLQDAPRLKSILKGGAEDRREPGTLEDIKSGDPPRTNPVNLLFVICQNASKIAELHFPPGREFHDLIMKTNLSSQSRATAFLWIMWFYLESDFTEEGCDENPFGPGVDYGVDVANQGVPQIEELTPEEEALENVDTPEEQEFGESKKKMRAKIIEADQQFMADSQTKRGRGGRMVPAGGDEVGATTGILPRIRPSKHESDIDSVRSTPPPRSLAGRQGGALASTGRRGGAALKYQIFEGSSPSGGGHAEGASGIMSRKPRPPTAHQLAVERNRMQRVEYIIDNGLRKSHRKSRKQRRVDGSIIRALNRLGRVADAFEMSEDDDDTGFGHRRTNRRSSPFREYGYGGLCLLTTEEDDFGEEFAEFSSALRRCQRRLARWENYDGPEPLGVIAPNKRPKVNGYGHDDDETYMIVDDEGSPSKDMIDPAETEDEAELLMPEEPLPPAPKPRRRPQAPRTKAPRSSTKRSNGVVKNETKMEVDDEEEGLNDFDKSLLGLADADDADDAEDLDPMEKTLLGIGGDSDSD
jgi:Ino eighty subunit 1